MQNKAQNKRTDALNTHHLYIPIPSNENSVRMRPVAFWRFSEILSKPFQLTKEFSLFVLSVYALAVLFLWRRQELTSVNLAVITFYSCNVFHRVASVFI